MTKRGEGIDTMKKIYGYVRISTVKQKLQRQIDNIKKLYPDAIIIDEAYTGTTTDRPKWNKLVEQIKKESAKGSDVTLVFDEVSRMSRNAKEGFEDYKMLYDMGVNLVFIKEHHIDTDNFRQALQSKISMTGTDVDIILTAVNEYMMKLAERQIEIAFETAQAEVNFLHKRTKEGIKKVQEQNEKHIAMGEYDKVKQIGQPKGAKLTTKKSIEKKAEILKHSQDFNGTLNDIDCMKLVGVARGTYYKYKRELRESQVE